jgi:glycosyltransferase involved in cell wall biosynthesis
VTDYEVILVDNGSTDRTVEKAKHINSNLTLVEIDDYYPGLAINKGVRASDGDFIVCLSAHCIPVNDNWLAALRQNFQQVQKLAGVYGRQVPTEASDLVDRRDLIRIFGQEKRVQTEYTFFHNANSMIRKEVWEQYPFDSEVTNIEDQIWADKVLSNGYKIAYEPDAAVYHHHGINQGNNQERLKNVVKTMESNNLYIDKHTDKFDKNPLDPSNLDIVCFVPLRQKDDFNVDSDETLIMQTLSDICSSAYIDDIFVASDTEQTAQTINKFDNSEVIIRPAELSKPSVPVVNVYQFLLEKLERRERYPDLVVTVDITHPFRPAGFVDKLINKLLNNGHDCIIPTYPEKRPTFLRDNLNNQRINEKEVRSERTPFQVSLLSLGCVSYADNVRQGERIVGDIGIHEVDNPLVTIEIHDQEDLQYWKDLQRLPDLID